MNKNNESLSLDDMIARLNVVTTDFIFSKHQCRHRAIAIAQILTAICQHKELMFFPEQQQVYFKMLKVWKALAYDVQKPEQQTSDTHSEPQHSISVMH